MVPIRKSHKNNEENIKSVVRKKKGDYPFVVYVSYKREGDFYDRILILKFEETYQALWFINALIAQDTWEWVDPIGGRKCIQTSSGIKISMFDNLLKEVISYKPSADELTYRNEQAQSSIANLKYGGIEKDEEREETSPKAKKEPKLKIKENPKPKIDKTGMITANDIAEELKVEGREVRGILRALKMQKPEGGWAWSKEQADSIKKAIVKGLEDIKKKRDKK